MTETPRYVLGSADPELTRLEQQASFLEAPSRVLLRAAGLQPGMRVLDLGAGLGHLAALAAELVGPTGEVVAVERDPKLLALARSRAVGRPAVRFVEGDARTFATEERFDAVIERLLFFHLPDAAAVLRRLLPVLRPGGLVVALDFDLGSVRSEPAVPLAAFYGRLITAGFRSARANPVLGARLGPLLEEAGVRVVGSLGLQGYLPPGDPRAPAMLAGVVASLAPQLLAEGLATEAELGLLTLAQRLGAALAEANAVLLPPVLAGAWGRVG